MAASDKPFRDQRKLDIVYALSCIGMLLSIGWMFAQDYYREHRDEQYAFRRIEVAMAQRAALELVPSDKEVKKAEDEFLAEKKIREDKAADLAAARSALAGLQPNKETAEAVFNAVNADVASITSFLYIALEHGDKDNAKKFTDQLKDLNTKLDMAKKVKDDIDYKMKVEQLKIDDIESKFIAALSNLKKINDRFDTQVRLAQKKQWGWADTVRTMPIINGYADPLKIHQFTIEDIPIDFNFKKVPRYDRCMSCHQGIDRPSYTRANLESLTKEAALKNKRDDAIQLYKRRMETLKGQKDAANVPDPHTLNLVSLPEKVLTPARVTEFCAHPNLDLYVASNSKHPAEKFGCTSCHAGQGSGTSFLDASHNPNSSTTRKAWTEARGWQPDHMWDFPMQPKRFIESSCLKCHHDVTDLITSDNRNEAPKLLRGHSLIKENGCFGCHEISGWKSGVRVGPDLRLEPSPPLEDLLPIERHRAENDTDNRPGTLRKVGPALARVSEKTHYQWIAKWLLSPSSFRPDTKMPHYYGLSTNDPSVLPEDQKKFPNTEIASIAYFLINTSEKYLADARVRAGDGPAARQADQDALIDLLTKGRLTEDERKKLDQVKRNMRLRKETPLVDLANGHKDDAKRGRILFTERGCLACHTHQGTETDDALGIKSDAVFGPDLSQVSGKFVNGAAGKKWLVQWIMNPQVHSPRSRMPVTHLDPGEAADIAAWLLEQPAEKFVGAKWNDLPIAAPEMKDLQELAKVYLVRMLSKSDIERFLKGVPSEDWTKFNKGELKDDSLTLLLKDVTEDERTLFPAVTDEGALMKYLGKKAVTRLGCFACHDIPGFESVKSIGVGLNDWGKKPADRLAFEDIKNFYDKHYYPVDKLTGSDGVKNDKQPYEKFYEEALIGHQATREGYLNQKIRDPRSYDYNRIRPWDDRARMPQFTFARPRKKAGEEPSVFEGRIFKEEAEAREAVATFVLGLVAEAIPTKSINQPRGDRLAEVKGRDILDKYNCKSCHLIRPGVYDFKPGSKTMEKLELAFKNQTKDMTDLGEFILKNHVNWEGRNPLGADRLTAFGLRPTLRQDDDETYVVVRLAEALRFVGTDKTVKNIPAGAQVSLSADDLVASPTALKPEEDIDKQIRSVRRYGGTFADLMAPWLNKRDAQKYPRSGDDAAARASLPPSLIGQGERTQADWLYQFLLNPSQVRRKSILRMPKFNMSNEEAKALVDYFAALTRMNNPGIGLQYPLEPMPQRDELDSPYWRQKTAEYIAMLKKTPAQDKDKKDIKGKTRYDERLVAYSVLWEQIRKDNEPEIQKIAALLKTKTDERTASEAKLPGEKDEAKQTELKNKIASLGEEIAQFEKAKVQWDVETQKESWHTKEAYAADSYRMLASRELCTKCHQVGAFVASELTNQGPPLSLASQRLRGDWIERWVNKPERFVPYQSLMPPYFNRNDPKWQQYHAGASLEQLQALRDVLLNYPRIANLPVNRLYVPDAAAEKK